MASSLVRQPNKQPADVQRCRDVIESGPRREPADREEKEKGKRKEGRKEEKEWDGDTWSGDRPFIPLWGVSRIPNLSWVWRRTGMSKPAAGTMTSQINIVTRT